MTKNWAEQEAERCLYSAGEGCGSKEDCIVDWGKVKNGIAQALRKAVSDNDEKWNKANDEMLDKQDAASFKLGFEAAVEAAAKVLDADYPHGCPDCGSLNQSKLVELIRNLKPEGTK